MAVALYGVVAAGGTSQSASARIDESGVPAAIPQEDQALRQETLGVLVVNNAVALAPNSVNLFESAGLADPNVNPGSGEDLTAPSSVGVESEASGSGIPLAVLDLCEATDSFLYCVYTVQEGDTLASIAATLDLVGNENVAPWELLVHSNQPDIVSENDLLQIGQRLRIPLSNGVIHTVLSAQTLTEIAERYDVTTESIISVAANGITDVDIVRVGQELLVPSPNQFRVPLVVLQQPAAPASPGGGSAPAAQSATVQSASGFIWPVGGPITSYFGPGHPLGLDIDLFQSTNAAIGAAAAGVVTFAGGNPCCSYGYYVIVDHGNGFQTLYAHFSSIWVTVGESVGQGQTLGIGGSTGYSTGPHLHFEVHLNGVHVDPLAYLP